MRGGVVVCGSFLCYPANIKDIRAQEIIKSYRKFLIVSLSAKMNIIKSSFLRRNDEIQRRTWSG